MKSNNFKLNLAKVITFTLIAFFLLYKLEFIPAGFFCDEALIAIRTKELLSFDFKGFYDPFTYEHFGYVVGTLPIISLLPIIFFLGMSELSVRLGVMIFAFAALVVLYFILKKLKDPLPIASVIIFATTPVFLHFSRLNFGQTQSLFFILLGYYFFLKIEENKTVKYSVLAAVAFGISGYGLGANVISTPLFVALLFFYHFFFIKNICRRQFIIFLLVFILMYLQFFHSFTTNPNFLNRIRAKDKLTNTRTLQSRIVDVITNYPKYYSYDYLFLKGENNVPGAFIKRLSINDVGILSKSSLPLLVLSIFFFLFFPLATKKEYLPFFSLFLLYPFPDIITTSSGSPPYTGALYATLFWIPFMTSALFSALYKLLKTKLYLWRGGVTLMLIFTIVEAVLLLKAYDNYRIFSADYWGWQSGPKEMVKYFLQVNKNYDEIYMTGMFNQPQIFLQFYDTKQQCFNCFIGGIDRYDSSKRQLFALTSEEYNNLTVDNFIIKKIIRYPDKSPAFILGEFTDTKP